jgi:TolA-binding protein
MTVRRALPYLAALLLGVCAALLAACAGNTTGGIAAASAADLKRQLEDVRERVDRGRCGELNGQLRQIGDRIDALPASVDEQLKQALRDGVSRLRSTAPNECNEADTQTQTQTTAPLETETTPEQTTAAPPTTQTTTGPATTTTPPSTPPTTTPTVTPPPPVEPPPPIGPGGGTPSEIPPP